MKKTITLPTILFVAFTMFLINNVGAQIADLDVSKYYMIINHGLGNEPTERGGLGRHAMGIDNNNMFVEGALIQQQAVNEELSIQQWQIIPITDSTYYFINRETEMALGLSEWRGDNPFWTGPASPTDQDKIDLLTVPGFNWKGSHRAAVQREFSPGDETQIWQPTLFPSNTSSGDTTFYRMTMAMNLADSGFCFNIWEQWTFEGFRNICVFPGTQENEKYVDGTTLYGYWFKQTTEEVPQSINDNITENINVFTVNGTIILEGELHGKTIEVYSMLGTKVYSTKANTSVLNIPIKQGVYIVIADKFVTKQVVR